MVCRCAQPSPLSGGSKDMTPPIIDSNRLESPRNGSIQVKTNRFEIPFNEWVKLDNPKKKIVITPLPKTEPLFFVKGKKVVVEFTSPLDDNTTYIINFGDAIQDITENNVMRNYTYVFSTGTYIDSLQYQTFIYDAFTKKPVDNVLVMLYDQFFDSVPITSRPLYFGRTNEIGMCRLTNLKAGQYKCFVLDDANSNYKFDRDDESVGYMESIVQIAMDTVVRQDTISMFTNIPRKTFIKDVIYEPTGKVSVVLNQPILYDSIFEPTFLSNILNKAFFVAPTRDSITFWLEPEALLNSSITVPINGFGKSNVKIVDNQDSLLGFKTNAINNLAPKEKLRFTFEEPILTIKKEQVSLLHNEDTLQLDFELESLNTISFTPSFPFREDENYELIALPNAFASFYGQTNDTLRVLFAQNSLADYGSIFLDIETTVSSNSILELLSDGKVIKRVYLENSIEQLHFDNLTIGNYDIRIIFDANNNAIWDTGDYLSKIPPERVEYYDEIIEVRKGWDVELKWVLE